MVVQAESERRSHVQRTTSEADTCPELVQGSALGLRSASDAMYMYLYLLNGFLQARRPRALSYAAVGLGPCSSGMCVSSDVAHKSSSE